METRLPPQPPPDVPAPPPGEEALKYQERIVVMILIGVVSAFLAILAAIHWITTPVILRAKKAPPERSEAINNIKQVGLCLFEFDSSYGRFPDATTIPTVKAATGTTLALGNGSSNELFRQLLATGTKSEKIFWANTTATPRKPNDRLGSDALVKGECAFTYIAGLKSSDDPGTPILMAPVIPGTWKFDPTPFGGMAVILRLDGSAQTLWIRPSGDVMIYGMNLFDPSQRYWNGKAPDIKWPE